MFSFKNYVHRNPLGTVENLLVDNANDGEWSKVGLAYRRGAPGKKKFVQSTTRFFPCDLFHVRRVGRSAGDLCFFLDAFFFQHW